MSRFAAQTTVSSEKSRGEIEAILRRYGANEFAYFTRGNAAMIAFKANGRPVKFLLPLPDPKSDEFKYTPARRHRRDEREQEKACEQAVRQRWRALALCIKAKLEAVEAGIVTFDDEFLAHFVLPGGETVGQVWGREYAQLAAGGKLPPLLEMGGS